VWTTHSFTNGLGIVGIVLVGLHVGLHELWSDEPNVVPAWSSWAFYATGEQGVVTIDPTGEEGLVDPTGEKPRRKEAPSFESRKGLIG